MSGAETPGAVEDDGAGGVGLDAANAAIRELVGKVAALETEAVVAAEYVHSLEEQNDALRADLIELTSAPPSELPTPIETPEQPDVTTTSVERVVRWQASVNDRSGALTVATFDTEDEARVWADAYVAANENASASDPIPLPSE